MYRYLFLYSLCFCKCLLYDVLLYGFSFTENSSDICFCTIYVSINDVLFCLFYFSVNDGQTPAPQYRGLRNAMATIFRQEGARGLYRGVTPNIWGSGSAWGFYFLLYVPFVTFIVCFYDSCTKYWSQTERLQGSFTHLPAITTLAKTIVSKH
jgi:hypothetical protein